MNDSRIQNSTTAIIQEAESFIYRRLRHYLMLSRPVQGTLTIGSDVLALPSDMLEPYILMITGSNYRWLSQVPVQDVYSYWASVDSSGNRIQSQPTMYSFDGTDIFFDALSDQAYPYALIYYQQPAALSGSNTTNFLTTRYPRMLRCACIAAACEYVKDSGQGNFDRTYWAQMTQDEIQNAQAESDRARRAVQAGWILEGGGAGFTGMWPYGWGMI